MASLPDAKQYSPDFEGFGVQCALLGSVAILCTGVFAILRRKASYAHLYQNTHLIWKNWTGLDPKDFYGYKLFWFIYQTEHQSILDHIGLDQYIYCEYLYTVFQISIAALVIPCLLMPIHYSSNTIYTGLDIFNINTLNEFGDSNIYFLHAFLTIYISILVMYKFYTLLNTFIVVRLNYLKNHLNDLHMRSVLVLNVPKELRTDEALLNYIQSLNIGSVESCLMVRDMHSLEQLVTKRKYYFHCLELAHIRIYKNIIDAIKQNTFETNLEKIMDKSKRKLSKLFRQKTLEDEFEMTTSQDRLQGLQDELLEITTKYQNNELQWQDIYSLDRRIVDQYHPIHTSHRNSSNVYLVDHLLNKLQYIDDLIDTYRQFNNLSDFKCTDAAFITFTNITSQQIICQCSLNNQMTVQPASQIKDVKWSNLIVRQYNRRIRKVIISTTVLIVTLLWIFFMTAVISLANYQRLVQFFPFLSNVPEKYGDYIQQILPTVVVTFFLALLPYLLVGLSWFEKLPSNSELDLFVTIRYFYFSVFNLIFVFTIGSSLLVSLIDVVLPSKSTTSSNVTIIQLLGENIPQGGFFYINYIVLQLNLHFLELVQFNWALVVKWFTSSKLFSNTPRKKEHYTKPWQFLFFYFYPTHALIFMIIVVYSIIHPFILIVGFIYFSVAYMVFKHQFMYAYVPKYDTNGQILPYLYSWAMLSLLFVQIIMISILLIKDAILPAILLFLLLLSTLYFWYHTLDTIKQCYFLPLDILPPLQREEGSVNTMQTIFDTLPVMRHDFMHEHSPAIEVESSMVLLENIPRPRETRPRTNYIHPLFYKEMNKTMLLPTEEGGTMAINKYLMSWDMLLKQ